MRRTAFCPFLISVVLLAASPLALAQGPISPAGKVGDCRDSVIILPAPTQTQTQPHAAIAIVHKAHPAQAVRGGGGGDDDNGTAPRVPHWHSFLPGMFR